MRPSLRHTCAATMLQYFPSTFAALSVGAGKRRVDDFKRGVSDAQSLQNPWAVLGFGGGGKGKAE